MKRRLKNIVALGAVQFLTLPSAWACSVCYGEPDSPMTRGLTWAIIALAGTVGTVLAGVTMFFVHANRRAKGLQAPDQKPERAHLPS
jgi:hypothetical protein